MGMNLNYALEFERPIVELENKIQELRLSSSRDMTAEIKRLEKKASHLQQKIFSRLTRWQVVQLSRHNARPCFSDYLTSLFTDFCEFAGDRCFAEDASIICGFARFAGEVVLVMGHQKGRSTKENLQRNFGMPRPEGYRKARRLMELAARFKRPILTFIDTPGAYPGIGAEERGQAQAIAVNLEVMAGLAVPIVSTVIGEGGSGGALAIGVGNRVLMLEYAVYSVISPEGCASILFRDVKHFDKAAQALKLTALDLMAARVIDEVIPEPLGGAHRNAPVAIENVRQALNRHLNELKPMTQAQLLEGRYAKFRALGPYLEK